MLRFVWIPVYILTVRTIYGVWIWAAGAQDGLGGLFGPERFVYQSIRAAILTSTRWAGARLKAFQDRLEEHRAAKNRAVVVQRLQQAQTKSDPGYYADRRGLPRCSRCGKEVRVRRGYCRSCGQAFALNVDPLSAIIIVITVIIMFLVALINAGSRR